jgi:hypothetical protein
VKGHRAQPSGIFLDEHDAAIAKGMIARGDRQHDIAAWFGVNGGRIGEIASSQKFSNLPPAPTESLPPPGPYLSGQDTAVLLSTLGKVRKVIDDAERFLQNGNHR